MSDQTKKDLLLLFERPLEPAFMPKGDDEGVVFEVPDNYVVERYRPLKPELQDRFSTADKRVITVKPINLPNLSFPMQLGRKEQFSLFFPLHRQMAGALITAMMSQPTVDDFLSLAVFCRDHLNPYMFFYAYSVALLHRPDTKNVPVPTFVEVFPEKYMDSTVFSQAREESNIVQNTGNRIPLIIPRDYTASDLEPEHRVAYFREDMGVNLHHWHWHLVYPFEGPMNIVNKDRRGELWYYMHQQLIARYNFERFSVGLPRVKRLLNLREPIPEGYFSKLDSLVASRVWPPRQANTVLSDINREVDQIRFDLQDMERWRDRIFQAIHTGSVLTRDGTTRPLGEFDGIDLLGNMVESSILSVNRFLYGDLHNMGHVVMGLCHDPDNRHLETFSVVADPGTTMRDPLFYRWHAFIDALFQEHKSLLPRYTVQQLEFRDVNLTSAEISINNQAKNLLVTLWQQSDVDLSRGMDFTPRGNIYARLTHLQHAPFSYNIKVQNRGQPRQGTCRVFIAPKFDERGLPFLYNDQRLLFIEMDKWTVNLKSGNNDITRKSSESSIIIPFERTFRDLQTNRPGSGAALEEFNFCGCGWPEHMLVPRGNVKGLACEMFVMVSDFAGDRVDDRNVSNPQQCKNSAVSFCGLKDAKFPDARPMGYPFDRRPRPGVNTLTEFLTPNMKVVDVTIRLNDRTLPPKSPGQNSRG